MPEKDQNKRQQAFADQYGDSYGELQNGEKKRGHLGRNILIAFGVLIVLLAVSAIVAVNLALQTEDLQKFDTPPDDGLVYTLAQSFIFGQEQEITDAQINAFFAYLFDQQQEPAPEGMQISADALAVYFYEEQPSEIYVKLLCGEQVVVLSALADIRLDTEQKQLILDIKETKIGALVVAPDWVIPFLFAHQAVTPVSDQISCSGSSVYVPSCWTVQAFSSQVTFEIKKFIPQQAHAKVLTTSAADVIEEFFEGLF
ncbi:MAG TPA: hypothetical protein IAD34_04575 [Candidatus Scatovicinus merdipullorum]|nr:hypothetical protein [Candidatus Scatovicinus merdipullorum]